MNRITIFLLFKGIVQIVVGILSIIVGSLVITIGFYTALDVHCIGIWFGALIVVSGILAVAAQKNPSSKRLKCWHIGFNGFCWLGSLLMAVFYLLLAM